MTNKELLLKFNSEGQWQSLRFTVYNKLDDEYYQNHLNTYGYESGYDDLESKTLEVEDIDLRDFKKYVESVVQEDRIIFGVYCFENQKYCTLVKPKSVEISMLLDKISKE